RAAKAVQQFVADKTLDDYRGDLMLRSAVERQFEIIGEALTQLRRLDASMVEKIQASRQAIGLRNILIHGYADVDDEIVWRTLQDDLPALQREVAARMPADDSS
ncbi:MAG: DUF86 domain-containing protein, partial [Salinisphaera sp.]|nr:DUF86 domain-containing protein [Salinisphaera sp.]